MWCVVCLHAWKIYLRLFASLFSFIQAPYFGIHARHTRKRDFLHIPLYKSFIELLPANVHLHIEELVFGGLLEQFLS